MSRYRRPRHHTYDYNFKVGESSYQDMLAYLDRKEGRRAASPPPGRKSFAERFVERPIYGDLGPLALGSATARGAVEDDALLGGKSRSAVAASDLEAEEFIAALRRRPRPAENGPSLPGEPGEGLGARTRRALRKIDDEFEAMGLYDKPSPAAATMLAVQGEEGAALSATSVSSARVSASVSKKVASSEESSARTKRSVRYEADQ